MEYKPNVIFLADYNNSGKSVVKSQVVLQSPFVERFHCIYIERESLAYIQSSSDM